MTLTRRAFFRLGLLAALSALGGWGVVNGRRLVLERPRMRLERLPESFDGFRLALISDVHAGRLTSDSLISEGVKRIMAEKPDLVALTGETSSRPPSCSAGAGPVRDGRRWTYVSRGLGLFLVPIRFNCPPEVTLMTLEKA